MKLRNYFEYEKNNLNSNSEDFLRVLNNFNSKEIIRDNAAASDILYTKSDIVFNYNNANTTINKSQARVRSPLFATFGLGMLVSAFAFILFINQNYDTNTTNESNQVAKYNTVEQARVANNIQTANISNQEYISNKKEKVLTLINSVNSFDSNSVIVNENN